MVRVSDPAPLPPQGNLPERSAPASTGLSVVNCFSSSMPARGHESGLPLLMRILHVELSMPLRTLHCKIVGAPGVVSKWVMPFTIPPHGACVESTVIADSLRGSGCTNSMLYAVTPFKYRLCTAACILWLQLLE